MKQIASRVAPLILFATIFLRMAAPHAASELESTQSQGAKQQERAEAHGGEVLRLAWQSEAPVRSPDFEGYFPDDPEAGGRLDVLIENGYKGINGGEEYLEAVRNGFRNTTNHRTLILSRIGGKYIWNKKEQHPLAIELMYHAVNSPNKGERHYAIYFGLSVVKPKTPAILKALVDIAMTTDDFKDTGRIAWGAADQREELIKYLEPYLASEHAKVREHAQALKKIFSGKMDAREYWEQNQRAKAEPLFEPRMEEFRERLATGDSAARREVLDTIRRHHLGLIIKDRNAWLEAYVAAAKDPDERVRRWVAQAVGSGWVWKADEASTRAIDVLLDLALDDDHEVRKDASYYGLSRLPKGHPAQARVDKVNQVNMERRLKHFRQYALKAIEDGKFKEVEDLLREIKPSDGISYNREGDREKVQTLYDEISEKLNKARRPSGILQRK